jgi:MerR family mercuric resistance operon transcriptional regulator
MSPMQHAMTIGGLAKAARVNVETIRYYQRLGLIGEPAKAPGRQRRYGAAALSEVGFVRRAQQLGFTLAEIKELQQLSEARRWAEVRKLAERRHARLALQARELARMTRRLKALLDRSRGGKGARADAFMCALRGEEDQLTHGSRAVRSKPVL